MLNEARSQPDYSEAKLRGLEDAANALVSSDGWPVLQAAIERHIAMLLEALEKGSDNDDKVRGGLSAYRSVLEFPKLLASKATKGI